MKWNLVLAFVGTASLSACTSGGPSNDSYRRACAFEVSCNQDTIFSAVQGGGQCVQRQQLQYADGVPFPNEVNHFYSCVNSSNSCDSFDECISRNHGPAYCSTHPHTSCDQDILVDCGGNSNGWGTALDCGALSLHCATANGASSCSDGTTCDPNAGDRCNGNNVVTCDTDTHLEATVDCNQVLAGSTCGIVNSHATCLTGANCTQATPFCDGNTLVQCDSNTNRASRIDCVSVFQGTCVLVNGMAQCVSTATACSVDSPDVCMGNNLQTCVNGTYQSTDCTTLGFRTCGTVPAGFLGHDHPGCVN